MTPSIMTDTALSLIRISKSYGRTRVLRSINLNIAEGEFISLLGPSGCGKTTTLRIVAGLTDPSEGMVMIGGADVTNLPPFRRNLGMVFQNYALFPHMTVEENVAFGLKARRVDKREIAKEVARALEMVHLPNLGKRYPKQLSGGQQQRIALARALVIKPSVLLLDEPLSNLDAKLRKEMRREIRSLQQQLGLTTLFVTHDQEEALSVSDQIVLMQGGQIQQIGTPKEIYEQPSNEFSASFMGATNMFRGTVRSFDLELSVVELQTKQGYRLRGRSQCNLDVGEKATIVVRPEKVNVSPCGDGAVAKPNSFRGRIAEIGYTGKSVHLNVEVSEDHSIEVSLLASEAHESVDAPGSEVLVWWDASCGVVFGHESDD